MMKEGLLVKFMI